MLKRIIVKLKMCFYNLSLFVELKKYKEEMTEDNPLKDFLMKVYSKSTEDPYEFFDHYDSFGYWEVKKVKEAGFNKRILDVGNKKIVNAVVSLDNEVTSLVLKKCDDQLSKVNYIIHDISNPLPFSDKNFDLFTSASTLHLAGLGRYGDKIDANVLPKFINELDRVLKDKSELLITLPLGKNQLLYNFHYIFDFETIVKLFQKWELKEYFVDEFVHFGNRYINKPLVRFSQDTNVDQFKIGEYKIIYLHFSRGE